MVFYVSSGSLRHICREEARGEEILTVILGAEGSEA